MTMEPLAKDLAPTRSRAVLAYIDAIQCGARLDSRGLTIDLASGTREDLDKINCLALFKRRQQEESAREAWALEEMSRKLSVFWGVAL